MQHRQQGTNQETAVAMPTEQRQENFLNLQTAPRTHRLH